MTALLAVVVTLAASLVLSTNAPAEAQTGHRVTVRAEVTYNTNPDRSEAGGQITVEVTDPQGRPASNVGVAIRVREANHYTWSPSDARTDANGQVQVSYLAVNFGRDRITAAADTNHDGAIGDTEPRATVTLVHARAHGPARPALVRGTTWYLQDILGCCYAVRVFTFGPGGVPVMGDWNGDGTATPGWYRDGVFHLRNSNTGGDADVVFRYGRAGDEPVVGDWNGDGVDTIGIVRGNRWHLRNSHSYASDGGAADVPAFSYGSASDRPIVGDWNGDGGDTAGVVRGIQWYLRNSNTTGHNDIPMFRFGRTDSPHQWPVVGDWHGFGADRVGLVIPEWDRGRGWHLKYKFEEHPIRDYLFWYGSTRTDGIPLVWH